MYHCLFLFVLFGKFACNVINNYLSSFFQVTFLHPFFFKKKERDFRPLAYSKTE